MIKYTAGPHPHSPSSLSRGLHILRVDPTHPVYPSTRPLVTTAGMDLPPPLTDIPVGDSVDVASQSKPELIYTVSHHPDGSYWCTCPAWLNTRGKPKEYRSCKHTRQLLGDAHENARCGESKESNPPTKLKAPPKPKAAPKPKSGDAGLPKKKRAASSSLLDSSNTAVGDPPPPKRSRILETSAGDKRDSQPAPEQEEAALTDPDDAGKEKEKNGGVGLLLAHSFDLEGKVDPTGWWLSEKLDGVRAYWDGQTTLWSRNGKAFVAPPSFLEHLPRGQTLDGELYLGRNRFDETSGMVRRLVPERWDELKYMVFDTLSYPDSPFEDRLGALKSLFPAATPGAVQEGRGPESPVVLVEQEMCKGLEHLKERLAEVQKVGGEGLMLRQPGSPYVPKRSKTLLKVKTFYDAEAEVVGYEPGKGKYEGLTGSLICTMEDGSTTFSVGSGLTDERRVTPPKVGAIITYRFFELTKQGIPRFPTFVGERFDASAAKDAVVREKDAPAAAPSGKGTGKKKKAA
ncbi:hypothetical protein JCM5296_002379 [Sporobolomyces johnsonii]